MEAQREALLSLPRKQLEELALEYEILPRARIAGLPQARIVDALVAFLTDGEPPALDDADAEPVDGARKRARIEAPSETSALPAESDAARGDDGGAAEEDGPAIPSTLGSNTQVLTDGEHAAPRSVSAPPDGAAAHDAAATPLLTVPASDMPFLARLPSAQMYERSHTHREAVLGACFASGADFLLTWSVCGSLKWWRKTPRGLEFVKTYRAHMGRVIFCVVSPPGDRAASAGADDTLRLYDVASFDMCETTRMGFTPSAAVWAYPNARARPVLVVAERGSPRCHLFNADKLSAGVFAVVSIHTCAVTALTYTHTRDTIVSGDAKGVVEYWSTDAERGYKPPEHACTFKFKSDTDLFVAAKQRACVYALDVSKDGRFLASVCSNGHVYVFHMVTGKCVCDLDESPARYEALQAADALGMDALEFGKRMSLEREYQAAALAHAREMGYAGGAPGDALRISAKPDANPRVPLPNVVFDESGNFIVYTTVLGLKIVHVPSGAMAATLGKVESSERFASLALYQGIPHVPASFGLVKPAFATVAPGASSSSYEAPTLDPTIVTTAFRRNRFYLFTRREPEELLDGSGASVMNRDVFNEPPSKEDLAIAAETSSAVAKAKMGSEAIIHTVLGDVTIKLLPAVAPKAVENFSTHSRKNYYNGHIFHRVIKGFMIQGGDPTGTGGESIWGHEFEDEVTPTVQFDKPFMLAMANAGPNSNGSQFFITTAPCPWLNGKHTIFGRVTHGMDVVKAIEAVRTHSKTDRPLEDVRIVNVTIK